MGLVQLRHHDNFDARVIFLEPSGCLVAVHAFHFDVQQHNFGDAFGRQLLNEIFAIVGLDGDMVVAEIMNKLGKAGTEKGVVVHKGDGNFVHSAMNLSYGR